MGHRPQSFAPHTRWAAALAGLTALAGLLAGCGNAKPAVSTSGDTDGVTSSSITVGNVASLSGPIPADFSSVSVGVRAYFDMINAEGGVNGRKILFPPGDQLDDQTDGSIDVNAVRLLVQQDHVFALVGIATPVFSGSRFLVSQDVPAFGDAISPDWTIGDNLFGAEGSYVDFLSPGPEPAYLAQQVGAHKVGLLAYSVTESQQACTGFSSVLRRHGVSISYEDLSIPAPAVDLTTDVVRMHQAGVQMVVSCLDVSANVLLSQTLQQHSMAHVTQYWLNGYDEATLAQNESAMNGVYFLIGHTPFELSSSQLPRYPGMQKYLAQMARYFPDQPPSEESLTGWINADLFVTALRMIGRDVTRRRLIKAINTLTAYTANGLVTPIKWGDEHDANGPYDCNVFVQVRHGAFVPVFGSPPSVFTCFRYPQTSAVTVAKIPPPPQLPGA